MREAVPVRTQAVGDTIDAAPPSAGDPQPVIADTTDVPIDSVGALADALVAEEFVLRNFALRPNPVPAAWATGVWEWDREGLQSSRALTLLELLEEVPGVIPLRGGDHGQPASATAFGVGAGRIRLYLDGVEMAPLDGGVVDLSRTGIAGLDRVRVERRTGELRVELFPLQFFDSRPYSFLEVGTGDLTTNLFRGVFAHPDALGGTVLMALDRVDTQGRQRQEPGTSSGVLIRHAILRGERLGLAWDLRRTTSRRPPDLWEPQSVERTDWAIRGRYEWAPWLQLGAFLQRSSLGTDVADGTTVPEEPLVNTESRTQIGGHLSIVRGPWWLDAEYRRQTGPGWPSSDQTVRAGGTVSFLGGAAATVEWQTWEDGQAASNVHGRMWTRPVFGFSLFGELENGDLGVAFWVPPDESSDSLSVSEVLQGGSDRPLFQVPPGEQVAGGVSLTERTGTRVGLEYRRGGAFVGAAILSIEADSLHPLGLPADRGGLATGGGSRSGYEVSMSLPLEWAMTGLSLQGNAQFWDQNATWRYLPERTYQARLALHDVFFESQNLELWTDIGVTGRDPMQVPSDVPGSLGAVPFRQSWFGRLQIRVSSVRLFLRWDNFTIRQRNQDYPGRLQPQTRAMYGIRWTLWN